MGWTSFNLQEPVKVWFKKQWDYENSNYEVLESALVKRNTLYGAILNKSTGDVFCAVFLVRWSNDHYNFSYKDMTEFAGPCEYECPEKIFKLLTPLDEDDSNDHARNWRKKVTDLHNSRKQFLNKKEVVFKLEQPFNYRNYGSFDTFQKTGRKMYAGVLIDNEFRSKFRVRCFEPALHNHEIIYSK